jgi:MFS transporter, ACS family, tartrate transporter
MPSSGKGPKLSSTEYADGGVERATIARVTRRLLPFLILLYLINFLDRTNVGFAATRMERDIGLDAAAYGLGAGIFFIAYFFLEVPSNVALHGFGARRWIARIMVTWGIVAGAMAFIQVPAHFFILRFLLGAAEAGFYPGVILYLSMWFPSRYRARVTGIFLLGIPIAQVIGAPVSTGLIQWGDALGFQGWRVMYLVEAVPAVILGICTLFYLTDRPELARWLAPAQREWLVNELAAENRVIAAGQDGTAARRGQIRDALRRPVVWGLAAVLFGLTAGSNALNFFLPSVVETLQGAFGLGSGAMTTGLVVAIPYAVAAVAMVFWGRHSDRTGERRFHCGGAAILAAVTVAVALAIDNPVVVVAGFAVLAAGVYASQIVFWSVPSQLLTGVGAAAAIGLINSVGNLSGFVGPYLTGEIVSATGSYVPAFLAIAGLVLLGGIGIVVLLRRHPLPEGIPKAGGVPKAVALPQAEGVPEAERVPRTGRVPEGPALVKPAEQERK